MKSRFANLTGKVGDCLLRIAPKLGCDSATASRRKSIHKDANGTALLLCPDMLRGTPFRFIRYDNLVIATFESFQALEQFVKLEAPLFQVILAAVKTRRDLKNKLREEENEKDMAGACSSRRSY
ncbi:hypothetical protein Rt10032_c05g2195 [Rhodotorula toruloides]|uniref:Uncharacterized protein n=1 Tax=Rhodotorula toruloides TaxID=5286 RepID=A0A511KCS5_RHOTO|nr:hypothetical protein Rt10032_c05g2195 [Rhodotorula toruloides]